MSRNTKIQWCDSTVNPLMGCAGCELFPKPGVILSAIDDALRKEGVRGWKRGRARKLIKELIAETWELLLETVEAPGPGHINAITTTNIYHLRKLAEERISAEFGKSTGRVVKETIEEAIKCYAAKIHLNRAYSIINPSRWANPGYAPTFEQVTTFEGRVLEAAKWPDLFGTDRAEKPWLNGLPRLIFLSDMGDALSDVSDFDFLRREFEDIQSDLGQRHLWMWLTKRPERMQRFADSIGGMPSNVCAMTTITSGDSLRRVDDLRDVDAKVRGLSVEPLWTPIADGLDLTGIDGLIVGGESGTKAQTVPFCVEWAEDLRALCQDQGVAFFLKQLGRQPTQNGCDIALVDNLGGDWDEWDDSLRVREMPKYFHTYRQNEKVANV